MLAIEVKHDAKGWSGVWRRPRSVEVGSDELSGIRGPAESRVSTQGKATADGVELTFFDPAPSATPDVFQICLLDATHARLTYLGAGIEPLPLVRSRTIRIGPFRPGDVYKVARRQFERDAYADAKAP